MDSQAHARRYARKLLELFGSEGTFEIAIYDRDERALVKDCFIEMGCEVADGRKEEILTITCPDQTVTSQA